MRLANPLILLLFSAFCLDISGQGVTYYEDIKPIIERNCVSCHRSGEVGAMPLTSYDQVSAYGRMIQFVTSSKLMPPWYADAAYSHFSNERVLTAKEIKTISDWVSAGMPPGKIVAENAFPDASQETATQRQPDLVISMAESFEQYGIYLDQYQVFVLPTHLSEDAWIEGVEFVPGNKKIVRFAAISIEPTDKLDSLDRWDPRYGYYSFGGTGKTTFEPYWYTWSPQQEATFFKPGSAKYIPAGSKLVVHMHYGPTGRPEKDSSSIRLYLASSKQAKRIQALPLINPYTLSSDSLFIPANSVKTFHASYTLPYDIKLMSLTPQANLLCRSWEIYAKIPGTSAPVKLLKISDWNFNWKQTYHLEHPLSLPKGTEIHALARYDNTLDNPCNPSDKPVDFRWGTHLFNELFMVHLEIQPGHEDIHGVLWIIPSVVCGDSLEALLLLDKTHYYEIQICGQSANNGKPLSAGIFKKGTNALSLGIADLPGGNYTIRAVDNSGNLIAEQMFVKMRENGL